MPTKSQELQQIIDFVEGQLESKTFEKILYENPRFEEVLNDDPYLPTNTYVGTDVYLYVIQQNFNSLAGVLNVHGALAQLLERNGVSVQPTKKYSEFYNLILSAQPKWLDVDPAYIQREIISAAGNLPEKELKKWLRSELLKRFKYVTKPPRWIQGANWPINENGPLVFLGQIQVNNYFHDEAAVYVFHDQSSGAFETVSQVY